MCAPRAHIQMRCAFTFTIPKCTVTSLKFTNRRFQFPVHWAVWLESPEYDKFSVFAVFFSCGMSWLHTLAFWMCWVSLQCSRFTRMCMSCIFHVIQCKGNLTSTIKLQFDKRYHHFLLLIVCFASKMAKVVRYFAWKLPHKSQNMLDNHTPFRQIYFTLICLYVSLGGFNSCRRFIFSLRSPATERFTAYKSLRLPSVRFHTLL